MDYNILNIPISAWFLCYGPLAITVLGFIVAAAFTDADARRRYLRNLDMRPDGERPEETPPVTRRINAETPSGARVTIKPAEAEASNAPQVQATPSAGQLPPASPQTPPSTNPTA